MAEKEKEADSVELAEAKLALADFLAANDQSSIGEITTKGGARHRAVLNPWNDESLAFSIPAENPEAFYEALNAVILPERFTAIYHKDTRRLEVIWTAYQLPESSKELDKRKFKFTYDGIEHNCHFSRSSDRLLTLAGQTLPLGMSRTSFRNLQSFDKYVKQRMPDGRVNPSIAEPISFWIENLDWDVDKVVEMINNLNFYLLYYDNKGAVVALHQVEDPAQVTPSIRYIAGKFPSLINGKKLDNNLLSFWEASQSGDPARRFQYLYRIIEYTSFFYLESSAKMAVRRILSAPDANDDISSTTEKLMSAFQMSKLDEHAKFSALLGDTVDGKLLWAEIRQNIPFFAKDFKFDGGFTQKAIISSTTKESTFLPKGVEVFGRAIREIRNALSHGRDFKSATVIIPTTRNLKALQPWVHLIAVAAGQVVLFRDVS